MAVIIATRLVIGARNTSDISLMSLVGLFSISVLVGRLEHFIDCLWHLLVELGL